MAKRPDLDRLPKITLASNGRLSNGKLDRIRRAAVSTDVDAIEELAAVFEVSPWQLLSDEATSAETSPVKPTSLAVARAKRWPLEKIDPAKLAELSEAEATLLQDAWLHLAETLKIDVGTVSKPKRKKA